MKAKDPLTIYNGIYGEAEKAVIEELGIYGDAGGAMLAHFSQNYSFGDIQTRDDMMNCIESSVMKYLQETKEMAPDDKLDDDETKIALKRARRDFFESLQRYGMDEDAALEKFKNGNGAELFNTYNSAKTRGATQRTIVEFYTDQIRAKGGDYLLEVADGYREKHKPDGDKVLLATKFDTELSDRINKELNLR